MMFPYNITQMKKITSPVDKSFPFCYLLFRHFEKYLNIISTGDEAMSLQESFKALSDPTRRDILNLLRAGPMNAGELLSHFSLTGASLSHHLSVLRQAGLIDDEKQGKYIIYTLNTTVLDDIMNWMMSLKGGHNS